jgi:hypothetical protein
MVRHHVKKKKGDKPNASKKQKDEQKRLEAELEDLDRFAGSSDEEESGDGDGSSHEGDGQMNDGQAESDSSDSEGGNDEYFDDEDEDQEEDVSKAAVKDEAKDHIPPKQTKSKKSRDVESDEEEANSDNDYQDKDDDSIEDDDFEPQNDTSAKSAGMANAMARILGGQSAFQQPPSSKSTSTTTSTNPVVLSKTTTPLQRLQQKIKTEEQALRQKRRDRRSENLSAMRLPLAPTAGMSADKLKKLHKKKKSSVEDEDNEFSANAIAIANEIEAERTHRRIATRGVVALFNAISKHRQAVAQEAAEKEAEKARIREEGRSAVKRKNEGGSTQTTKHGFLDMIKKSAVGTTSSGGAGGGEASGGAAEAKAESQKGSKAVGWSALKDDFMMNSKLKDWDKELSDDDDDDDDEPKAAAVPDKKGKGMAQASRKRQKS